MGFVASLFGFITCNEKVIVGYYVPWGKVEPETINYKKVTHINYGFGILQDKEGIKPTNIFLDQYYDGKRIKKIRDLAKENGVKVLMSLGGWTGSQTFSKIVRDENLRKEFIQEALKFLSKNTMKDWEYPNGWELDGIDLDWEYPNRNTTKCNIYHKDDTANYLILLKELREAMNAAFPDDHKLLTAAVRVEPFDDVNGKPSNNVKEFAEYFDYINIMTYDSMGPFSNTTGPNAPYIADIKKYADKYSFTQGIDSWLNAGFPANKLTAGLAFYGRSMTTNVNMDGTTMYVTKESVTPKGDESDANEVNKFCNEGSFFSGVYKYKFLRKDILTGDYTKATNGYTRYFDEVTQTPWLFNPSTKRFISYDDPQSIKVKVDYIKKKGLRGAMIWELSQDFKDELLNVVQQVRDGEISNSSPLTEDSVISQSPTTNRKKISVDNQNSRKVDSIPSSTKDAKAVKCLKSSHQ